jgi:predicted RecA/RadA family phage recombinase
VADYLPKYRPGEALSPTASADVIGGRLVSLTAAWAVGPSGADSAAVLGVAGFDAKAGETVTVYTRAGGVQRLTASGAIAVGAKVSAAAAGKIQTLGSTSNPIGLALQAAAADGDVIDVLFI